MSLPKLDYSTLNPGIRDLVKELREVHGLETCDSGDGVTNVEAGMEGALEERHVFILVELDRMIETTKFLSEDYPDAWVECSWSPGQEANIMIFPDGLVLPPGVSKKKD
jgi:hypothetical protein